jgi:formylglycine-generating enzyme required for sulfatase activity
MMKGCLVLLLAVFTFGRLMAGEPATAVATITAGFVTGITVTSGGSGYTSEPSVTLSGGGGIGASGKAIMAGDKVALILVLTAGSGYSTAPTVVVDAPPKPLSVSLRLIPELTIEGPPGILVRVESAGSPMGPWTAWTNVTVSKEGVLLMDLTPGAATRFYRTLDPRPTGPAGFVWIAPGAFMMGSPTSEPDRDSSAEVQRMVTLTQGFWMSDHEVTQAEYQAVMGSNPSESKGLNFFPVEMVSWSEADSYCKKLTEQERAAGRITFQHAYRLPTEAEWEYAARAGTTGARYGELDAIAWHGGNSGNQTHAVKQKAANAWGLYDMMGNVWEWCSDWYLYPRQTGNLTDPKGPSSGSFRVKRGGSWVHDAIYCRSACVSLFEPTIRVGVLGFRPVLSDVR